MKRSIIAAGVCAAILSVVPAFAMEEQDSIGQPATAIDFPALSGIEHEAQLNDSELAKVEGTAPFAGAVNEQIGLVNVSAQAAVQNTRIIRDVTVEDINVAILAAGSQR